MPRHLQMLDSLRVQMVQKRYPAKLINIITRIYEQGLADMKTAEPPCPTIG